MLKVERVRSAEIRPAKHAHWSAVRAIAAGAISAFIGLVGDDVVFLAQLGEVSLLCGFLLHAFPILHHAFAYFRNAEAIDLRGSCETRTRCRPYPDSTGPLQAPVSSANAARAKPGPNAPAIDCSVSSWNSDSISKLIAQLRDRRRPRPAGAAASTRPSRPRARWRGAAD